MKAWHEDNSFWCSMAPKLFSKEKMEKAFSEVDQVIELSGISRGEQVLDLCCGPGRHAVEFARRGYKVTGVDKNREYLKEARRRAAAEETEIDFIEEDMRVFRKPGAFSAVFNLFNSFGYFEDKADDLKVLRNVYESLVSGGIFVLELMGKEVLAKIFCERDWYEEDGVIYLEESRVTDDWKRAESRWIKLDGEKTEEFTVSHRLYSARELSDLLTETGFRDVDVYGSLAGIPYDQHAERLVILSRKPRS
jgi:SAM-dependent methyltransferase